MVADFFVALAVSFSSVFTAELGDKTQLFAFLLGAYFGDRKILLILSVFLGMGAVTALGYAISVIFQRYIETKILQIVGGSIFILIGTLTFIKAIYDKVKQKEYCEITKEEEKTEKKILRLSRINNPILFVGALSLLFVLMELGDKSQIIILVLFFTHNWVGVFIGSMIAFLLLNGISILLASFIKKICENQPLLIAIIAALVSIGLGIWMIVG